MPTIRQKKSDFTLAILCDLSKTFDVISHEILLKKLEYYGLRGMSNVWFGNYLSNRKQFVDYENTKCPVYWTYYVVCLKVPYLDHFCTYYMSMI